MYDPVHESALLLGGDPITDLYVKVRPIIVRTSAGAQGVTEEEAVAALQIAIDLYKEQDITIDYDCIRYLDNTVMYNNPQIPDFGDDSAIELFLYDHNRNSPFRGLAESINSTGSWSDIRSDPRTLAHELGHNLGLFHTWQFTECGDMSSDSELVDGSNCTTAGDRVCDTPAEPSFASTKCPGCRPLCGISPIILGTACEDANGDRYEVKECYNIMTSGTSETEIRDIFTQGQADRIREQVTDPKHDRTTERPLEVSSDMTIGNDKTFNRDITVKKGGVLTLKNSTFQFSQCAGIMVEQGGELNVDNATLTVATDILPPPGDYFWNGISGENDLDDGIPLAAARIVIRNSTIERAEGALKNAPNTSTFEERRFADVFATNTTFKNNKTSGEFIMVQDFSRSENLHRIQLEGVHFTQCNFIVDSDYPATAVFNEHISALNYIDYVSIRGCKFENLLPANAPGVTRKSAIRSFGVRINVGDDDGVRSSFKGFDRALEIYGSPLDFYRISSIRNTDFEDNLSGIFASAEPRISITGCTFDANNTSIDPFLGGAAININACASPFIMDNDLLHQENAAQYTGLALFNCGRDIQSVKYNSLDGYNVGISFVGNNGSAGDGMTFECNEFSNMDRNDVRAQSASRSIHGNFEHPTGNIHSRMSEDIDNTTSSQWDYYIDPSQSDQEPIVMPSEVNVIDANTNYLTTCPDGIGPRYFIDGPSGPVIPGNTLPELEDRLDDLQPIIGSIETLIQQGGGSASQKAKLKSALASYRTIKNTTIDEILAIYDQEATMDMDKIRHWLSRKDGYFNRLEIAKSYVPEGKWSSALSTLNALRSDSKLTPMEKESTDDMKWIMQKMYGVHTDPTKGWDDLLSADQTSLKKIMDKGNFASATAEGILVTFYDYIAKPYEYKSSSSAHAANPTFSTVSELGDDIPFYPNPIGSGQEINLSKELLQIDNVSFAIFDVNGRLLKSENITGSTINIDDLHNGYYFIQFSTDITPYGVYKLLKL